MSRVLQAAAALRREATSAAQPVEPGIETVAATLRHFQDCGRRNPTWRSDVARALDAELLDVRQQVDLGDQREVARHGTSRDTWPACRRLPGPTAA